MAVLKEENEEMKGGFPDRSFIVLIEYPQKFKTNNNGVRDT